MNYKPFPKKHEMIYNTLIHNTRCDPAYVEEIIKQAAKVLSEGAALLKRVQIYLCHNFSGQKLKDIGLHFGIGVSGVSQASCRVSCVANQKR